MRKIALASGTAANALCLAAASPPWGAVLCHHDAHIHNDECGAPEFYADGAKLLTLGGEWSKLDPEQVRAAAEAAGHDDWEITNFGAADEFVVRMGSFQGSLGETTQDAVRQALAPR